MFEYRLVNISEIDQVVSLVKLINTDTELSILTHRITEMFGQNYECMGVYHENNLVGCSGLWYQTRHYSGKSVEPDHVVIDPKYRNKGLGKKLINHCIVHAQKKGCEVTELNCYLHNTAGLEFWEHLGFKKLGYHFLQKINHE